MAKSKGNKDGKNPKRVNLKLFFLNGQLHKRLFVNRGKDLLTAWNYPDGKKVLYNYSDVVRRHEKAFTTTEVAKMVNRSKVTLDNAMKGGMIEFPQYTYGLDENRNKYQYMWREQDILDLLEYLATVHRGRPRKDGEITTSGLPTPREVRAMINDESILYVKQGDMFIPSWRAKEF